MSFVSACLTKTKAWIKTIAEARKNRYLQQKRKRLKNTGVSVIANDCIGGVTCHDLGLRFLSPTVNLFFETDDDYFTYLEDLAYYNQAEPVLTDRPEVSYPVGQMEYQGRKTVIHFMHYPTFENAKQKWMERGKRVNYDNLLIIWHYPSVNEQAGALYQRFQSLPFKNKIIVTRHAFPYSGEHIYKLNVYEKDYFHGKVLEYKSVLSKKRYSDDVPFVDIINRCGQ